MADLIIRRAQTSDSEAIWQIIQPVIAKGDTYAFDPLSSKDKMLNHWLSPTNHAFVAEIDGFLCGTYILKDNHPDLGSHIANGSYMVHPDYWGQGIGKSMGQHSIEEARQLGYHALQFNLVVKSNEGAINLWKKLGFEIIGEIPEAYNHQQHGLTNAYIMFKQIVD